MDDALWRIAGMEDAAARRVAYDGLAVNRSAVCGRQLAGPEHLEAGVEPRAVSSVAEADERLRSLIAPVSGRASAGVIEGVAVPFERYQWIGARYWGFYERFAPGAFDATLEKIRGGDFDDRNEPGGSRGADVRALVGHDREKVIGRARAGTLALAKSSAAIGGGGVDDGSVAGSVVGNGGGNGGGIGGGIGGGLLIGVDVADTTVGRDVVALVSRGDVSGFSVGFRPIVTEWREEEEEDGEVTEFRTVLEAELIEVSVVAFPAYADAVAQPGAAASSGAAMGADDRDRARASAAASAAAMGVRWWDWRLRARERAAKRGAVWG